MKTFWQHLEIFTDVFYLSLSFLFCLFGGVSGVSIQDFALARKELNHLNHTSSTFLLW
jgi:hypothetical protein